MAFLLKAIFTFRLNLIKSILFSLKSNGKRLNIQIYGKCHFSIDSTARIHCLNQSKLYFNKGINQYEPFIGMLEMYSHSKLLIENSFTINSGAHIIITSNSTLKLGSGYINRNCKIKCFEQIVIGNNVVISENVTIWDSDVHLISENTIRSSPITIEDNVWIGTNCIILKGVIIGEGSVIAAGSLVNKSIPKNCLAAGNPAKVIKSNICWKI